MENTLFNEENYLQKYPDVRAAVNNSQFISGYDHYIKYGQTEGRNCDIDDTLKKLLIDRQNPDWSNHLTLGTPSEPAVKVIPTLNAYPVPDIFKQIQNIEYPEGNKIPFEKYFEGYFSELFPATFRTYLPIYWTSYYVNNGYGQNIEAMAKLQDFINSLPKDKKYFTIIQYDDGILNNISELDILVYSMGSNKPGYYPLPLICQPTNCLTFELTPKNILYSFLGANTHPIREKLVSKLGFDSKNIVSFDKKSHSDYIEILKKSYFALCPRGYGLASFRMFEAMAYGCIPVYISDSFWEPFNMPFTEYGIKITENEIDNIPNILTHYMLTDKMQFKVKSFYENYCIYSSCAENIIKTLL